MSPTMTWQRVLYTIRDREHLPDRMYQDDVNEEIRATLEAAMDRWYTERGHLLLSCEPMVSG